MPEIDSQTSAQFPFTPYYEEGEWVLAHTKDYKWIPARIIHRTEGIGWIDTRSFTCEDEHGKKFEPIMFACPGISVLPFVFPSLANAKEALSIFEMMVYDAPIVPPGDFRNTAETRHSFATLVSLTDRRRWKDECKAIELSLDSNEPVNLLPDVRAMDTMRSMNIDPDLFNL